MLIPSEYVADQQVVESHFAKALVRVTSLKEAGFSTDEIIGVISKNSLAETDMSIAMMAVVENISISESIVKHVNSKGEVTRTKDRETRKRNAFKTTGLTAATRRQIARRAAKTKRSQPTIGIKAQRKTKRALKRRKALGL